jgi:anti-sigma-K factor RskA
MTADDDRELAASSGAYALDALGADEAQDFEALLQRSPGLRAEVTELTDTAVELGLAVAPEAPPADLRARVLAGIATTPQLAETVDDVRVAPVTPIAWYRRPAGALAAAAAAVVLAAGGAVGAGIAQSTAAASRVAAIAAAPDAEHATARIAGGGTARVVWSDRLARSGVELDALPALGLDRTYQFWYIDGSHARSAGTSPAVGDVVLTGALHRGDVIGITVEPAGGSSAPTSAPILTVPTT